MTTSEREATIRHIAETIASMTEEQFNELLRRMRKEFRNSEVNIPPEIKYNNSEAPHKRS